jgi:hypothetical protein
VIDEAIARFAVTPRRGQAPDDSDNVFHVNQNVA